MVTESEYLEETKALLAALEREQAEIDDRRQKEDELRRKKRAAYLSVIATLEENSATDQAPKTTSVISFVVDQLSKSPSGRAPKGAADALVDDVLSIDLSSGGLDEIRKLVSERAGIEFGQSTIYRALDRGREKGIYKFENGVWSLNL